ncbi:peritrophin-44 [Haematobia irritans]|uniref:peritrophin-44 n=1 Tax=Haematobia irritans TaxID=7368 RepID=UPI003F4FB7F0
MNKNFRKLLMTLAILTAHIDVNALEFPECFNVSEPDTFVSSKRSCSKYIFCDGDASFEGECLGGNFFNEVEGICDDPENVKCNIVGSEGVQSIFDEKFQKSDIDDEAKALGEDQSNGDADDLIDGDDINQDLNFSSANEIKGNELNSIDIVQMSNAPKCSDNTRAIHHIPHQESCSAFFTCYNGLAIPMLCPRNTYFNAQSEKCDQEMPTSCKLRSSVRLSCRKGVYDYMPHPQICEYYHYCLNGFLMIMSCPYDFTWHYERRTCVHKSQSKCYGESSILDQQPVVYRSYIQSDSS